MRAIYPGSFDPITNGHMDIIHRAALVFEEVIVAVLNNSQKQYLFTLPERVELVKACVENDPSVRVGNFDGLLVDYARQVEAEVIIRGLRAVSDFEYEMQMSLLNRRLAPELETFFLVSTGDFAYLSSSLVRDIAKHHGDLRAFVPDQVQHALREKFRR